MDSKETNISWDEQKDILKLKISNLADNNLKYEEQKSNEIIEKLHHECGKSKEEMKKIITDL